MSESRPQATRTTDKLITAFFQKEGRKSTDDQNALVIEIPLFVMEIFFDGSNIGFVNYQR